MNTVIVSAARTPIGSFMGTLFSLRAPELGSIAIREAVRRAGLKPEQISEVIMGCVLAAGLGQSPARQAALGAGLPQNVGVLTVNKVCSSGLKSVMLADAMIRSGEASIFVAGGMESMSNAPYLLPKAREGLRLGDGKIVDSVILDGLWDAFKNIHMGSCAEMCVREYKLSREAQDAFAVESYRRALLAEEKGFFQEEIAAVEIPQRKGSPLKIETDEEPKKVVFEKIPGLKPVFEKEGTITAANASSINDGAAAVVLMSEEKAKETGCKPLAGGRRPMARIVGHTGVSKAPEWFTTAPVDAIKKLLDRLHLKTSDIDLWEINEAFAAVTMATIQELKLDPKKVNVNGGAVALGHPIGASGARLLTSLLYEMKRRGSKRGLVSLCNGGGEAVAMVVESV